MFKQGYQDRGNSMSNGVCVKWTDPRDGFLVFYGKCLALAFGGEDKALDHLARYDFHCAPKILAKRLAVLRKAEPEWVKLVEDLAAADEDSPPPGELDRIARLRDAYRRGRAA